MIRKNENSPDIKFLTVFDRQLSNAQEEVMEAFFDMLVLFLEYPEHPFLRNHELKERFAGLRSIDVTGDWRAVFKESRAGQIKIITFHLIGTRKDLNG